MRISHVFSVAGISLLLGVWTGCTVGLDGGEPGTFECVTNDDCLDNNECRDGFCYKPALVDYALCVDKDNDGYGVGTAEERQECRLCESHGACEEDCNDNDATINPGAGEGCNGDLRKPAMCR